MRNVPKLRFKGFIDEWKESHLEELTKIITKQTGFDYSATIKPSLVKERADDTVPFIQNKDFKGKHINYNTDFYIPKNIQKKFPKITLDEKCILITISGNIGNVGLFNYNELSFIGGAVGVIKIKDISMLDYLFYYLISTKCQKKIISNEKTSAHKNITVEDIRKLIIKFPCSNEQEKIANFLSSIDKKISITEEKLDLFKDYKKGVMQKIFNQELRFKDSNGNDYPEWEEKNFQQLVLLQRGSSPRPIVKYITTSSDGVNWIKIGDTNKENRFITSTSEKITKEGAKKSREVKKGEIILSNSMSYGRPFILKIDGYIHDGWFVLRNYEENLNKEFLCQLLGSEIVQKQYKKLAAGGVVENISSELVNAVNIELPCLEEQEKIANFLSSIDNKIDNLVAKLEDLKEFKKGLLQQMFV